MVCAAAQLIYFSFSCGFANLLLQRTVSPLSHVAAQVVEIQLQLKVCVHPFMAAFAVLALSTASCWQSNVASVAYNASGTLRMYG